MKWLRATAAEFWLKLLFWCVRFAPGGIRFIGLPLASVAWHISPGVKEATTANAARILGPEATRRDCRRLGRRMFVGFYTRVLDFGLNRTLSVKELLASIENVEGVTSYDEARWHRRGAVLVTAHLGPFETAIASLRQREPRIHVVFQRDAFTHFERLRSEQRERLGVLEAPIDDGLATWFRLRDALLADEVVLMQGDRVMPGQCGRRVPFLHGHIEVPDGPVRLAELTGAPLVPAFAIVTQTGKTRIILGSPIFVGAGGMTVDQAVVHLAGCIAEVVRNHPEQWLMLAKAWIEDRRENEQR